MNIPREELYQKIFELFSGASEFVTISRKLEHWADVAAERQPALFQIELRENYVRQRGLPPQVRCDVEFYLYASTGGTSDATPPSSILNPLLDSFESLLVIDDMANQCCTLGGLVSHCWIEGTIEIFEGLLGNQAVAIIPVSVLVPA